METSPFGSSLGGSKYRKPEESESPGGIVEDYPFSRCRVAACTHATASEVIARPASPLPGRVIVEFSILKARAICTSVICLGATSNPLSRAEPVIA